MKLKKDQEEMERYNRISERNSLLRLADANNINDHNKMQFNAQQKKMVGEITKHQINVRDKEIN